MAMKDVVKWKICSQLCMLTMHTHVPKIVPCYLLIPYYRHHCFAAILISCCSWRIHASWTFPFVSHIMSESCLRCGFSQYTGQMFPKDPKWSAAIWSVLSHVGCWISRMQVKKHPLRTDFSIQINLQTKTKHTWHSKRVCKSYTIPHTGTSTENSQWLSLHRSTGGKWV